MSKTFLELAELVHDGGGDGHDDDISQTGKEVRKAKLLRSRSLSSQPSTSIPLNPDRPQ